jgi:hypothetical protein
VKSSLIVKNKYCEVIEMIYAMRGVVVAGILLAGVGCKKAETPVPAQPEVAATEPTPAIPASAPSSTGPIPRKLVLYRLEAPVRRVPKRPIGDAISGHRHKGPGGAV